MAARRIVLWLGLSGALLFAAAFAWSLARPIGAERMLRGLVQAEMQRRLEARIDAIGSGRFADLARRALGATDGEMAALRQRVRDEALRRMPEVVDRMLDPACDCRRRLGLLLHEAQRQHLGSLLEARERLTALVESAYAAVSRQLLREFRIFTASNAMAFGLLALTAWRRRAANLQLLVPAIVIVGAVAVTGGLYLFAQDWLHTIVFGDYLGLGYAAWLAAVALLLADILLNRARVSTRLFNAAANVVGAAVQASPC